MKKIFIFLAWLNGSIYLLIGVCLACIFLINNERRDIVPFLREWKTLIVVSYFTVVVIEKMSMNYFYGRGQTVCKEIQTSGNHFFVYSNLYFKIKINSEINDYKKTAGYIYLIFRVIGFLMNGFLIGVAFYVIALTYPSSGTPNGAPYVKLQGLPRFCNS